MKYLTTLEVARQLGVSKQTLLNWLYAGKVPEPPRNKKGYRLWNISRVTLVKKLIGEGRLNKRTVLFREVASRPDIVTEYAREVNQFLRENGMNAEAFLKELARFNPEVAQRLPEALVAGKAKRAPAKAPIEGPQRKPRLRGSNDGPG